MADCPALSTEDGDLFFSTDSRSAGSVVVIGCSGFGRQKTAPTSVLCTGGDWSPEPTPDCETGFDEREVLLLGVGVGCAVLALIVLGCLCCSCCFFRGQPKYMNRWWIRRYSDGDRYIVNRGIRKFSSYPRDTRVSRRETYRQDYDDRSERSFRRSRRYSNDFDKRSSYGKTKVFTREAYIPNYDFFDDEVKPRVSERGFSRTEMGRSARFADEIRKPALEYSISRRHSAGNREDMMRRTVNAERYSTGNDADMLRRTGYSINRSIDVEAEAPEVVQYVQTKVVEPIVEPIMQPIVEYVEKPVSVQYVEEQRPVEYVEQYVETQPAELVEHRASYTASFILGGHINPVVHDDEMFLKYDKRGFSSLPRANITEVTGNTGMKVVPYKSTGSLRSSQTMDPTMYFLGRQDYRHDAWHE